MCAGLEGSRESVCRGFEFAIVKDCKQVLLSAHNSLHMAIYIPRKAFLSWNFTWLAYANMTSSVCECTNTKSIGFTSMMKCAHTKMVSSTSAENNSSRSVGSTSSEMCTHMKMLGLTKQFALHCGFSQDVRLLHVLPTSHAVHSTNAEANTQCCSCGKYKSEKGFLICPSCNAVQALNPSITHFQIFDQDEKFELDLKDLEAKYKSLMKKLHPDLSHGKSTEEKKNYAQLSALVTTAYNDLLKPVSRATYMLKLRGVHVEEEGTVTDSELIMEVMEIRETLQSSPDRKTLEQLHKTATNRMDEWSEAFKSALKEGNDTNAVGALQRMSYFGRVCEDINRELL